MTDVLKAKPFDSRSYSDSMVTLDVDLSSPATKPTALDQVRADWLDAANAVAADETGLSLELRRLIPGYLAAREAYEETGHALSPSAAAYARAREAVVHVLAAFGAYPDDDTAAAAVDAFEAPYLATMFVERWADREGYLTQLGSGEVSRIAAQVQDLVAEGRRLDDMGMADLVEPYLPGGAA